MRIGRTGRGVALTTLAALAAGCRTTGLHASQGGVSITAGQIELSCEVHGGQVGFWFSGLNASSVRGPITRTLFQLGVDADGDGLLDETEVHTTIDNPNPGPTSVIAGFQGTVGQGSTVLAHVEVYTGGSAPVFSRTYTSR